MVRNLWVFKWLWLMMDKFWLNKFKVAFDSSFLQLKSYFKAETKNKSFKSKVQTD